MKYTIKHSKQLIDELIDMWIETKIRCDRIKELVKHLIEQSVI